MTPASSGASPGADPSPSARPQLPLWPLVLITFSGTSAMHMFVPALSLATRDLQASSALVQMTITVYILGLAFGQLVCGPLSDAFGRRPVLMAGLVMFTVSGLVAVFAPNVQVLLVARLFQALGGCTGLLMPRAMLRDTAEARVAVKRLALLNLITSAGPGLSPIVGASMAGSLGWRSIFVLLTLMGAANMWLCWKLLPETTPGRRVLSLRKVAVDYGRLLRVGPFVAYAVGGGCAMTSMYAFIVAAPFIFVEQLHRPVHEVGLYLGLMVLGASVGSALSGWLVNRWTIGQVIMRAQTLSVACAVGLALAVLPDEPSVALVVGLVTVYAIGAGACGPAVSVQAMNTLPGLAGSAGGFLGFMQMLIGALCTALVGLGDNPAHAAATVLVVSGTLGQLLFRFATRQR